MRVEGCLVVAISGDSNVDVLLIDVKFILELNWSIIGNFFFDFAGEEQNSARNHSLLDVVSNFEVVFQVSLDGDGES